jgi:hypothetical protein
MVLISTKTAPARETVQVSFTKNVNIEISMMQFYNDLIITEQLFAIGTEHHIHEAACLYLLHEHGTTDL